MANLVLGEAETNFIFESDEYEDDDDELGPAQERDRLEKVARVVRNSYEFAGEPEVEYRATVSQGDRWLASKSHIKKRIQSTKRHTKGALKKKYNEIKGKRQGRDERKAGTSQPSLAIFGVPLAVAVQRSVLSQGVELPTIVRQCIDFLEERGLDHEGVYRLSGVKSRVEGIKALYDKGDDSVDFSESDPNTVSGALKLFLRELPECVLSSCVAQLEDIVQDPSLQDGERRSKVRELLVKLPRCNFLLIGWLMIHLSHVAENAAVNKMSVSNLIIVFAPTLKLGQNVLHYFFNNVSSIFPGIELKRYVISSDKRTKLWSTEELEKMDAAELTWELLQTEDFLSQLNKELLLCSESEKTTKLELVWPYQRQVTQIKRLLRPRAKRLLSNSSVGKEKEQARETSGPADGEKEDWDSLQGVVLLALEAEVLELEEMERDLRQQLAQENEWAEMVREQIAQQEEPVYEEDTREDRDTYRDLCGQIEQYEEVNEQLCSDLAHELQLAAHYRAQLKIIHLEA